MRVVLALLVLVVALAAVAPAVAADYTRPCTDAAVWDPDVCERAEASAVAAEDTRQMVGWVVGVLLIVAVTPVFFLLMRGS